MSVKNEDDEDYDEEDEEEGEEEGHENENKSKQKTVKVARELPDVDIYESPKFNDPEVEANVLQLQMNLKEKLKGKNRDERFNAYNDLGTAYYRLFKFDKAELCHHQHLQLAKPAASALALSNKRPPNKKEEMVALANLGCVYQAKGESELALQTYKKAYDIAEELENKAALARILNNISTVYEKAYDFESAIESQKQRKEYLQELSDINGSIKTSATLGNMFMLLGDIRESIMHFENAVIGLRMKIVKTQMDEFEANENGGNGGDGGGGEAIEDNAEYYDQGIAS